MAARFFGAIKTGVWAMMVLSTVVPSGNAWAVGDGAMSEQVTAPTVVRPSPQVVSPTTPDLIMTAFATGDRLEVIELYNQSTAAIDLGQVSLVTTDMSGAAQTVRLQDGWLLPKRYATFADSSFVSGALGFDTAQSATTGDIASIRIMRLGTETQSVSVPRPVDYAWAQHKQRGNATLKQTGDFATDFAKKAASSPLIVASEPLYSPPVTIGGLEVREIHANPTPCAPVIESSFDLRCGDYIKVVNTGEEPVNLASIRLRVGKFGDAASIATAFSWQQSTLTPDDEYVLDSGAMLIVRLRDDLRPIALSASGNYVWIEDSYGITTYTYAAYPDLTLAQYRGKSWGFDPLSGQWHAANPSPDAIENDFTSADEVMLTAGAAEVKPCRDGQYRSEETGRCRSIALAGGTLTPCREGQYRSEETNRCRSIVSTVAAVLKPCADDQFRNPETGRCKKIASSEDGPAPCEAGWERNPETNRCRKVKVADMPLASFPVEPIKQTANSIALWWALGGIGTLVAGYAVWEWRAELAALAKRIAVGVVGRK